VIYIMLFRARTHDVMLVRPGPYSKAADALSKPDGFAFPPWDAG
jgi:hypothetical protein